MHKYHPSVRLIKQWVSVCQTFSFQQVTLEVTLLALVIKNKNHGLFTWSGLAHLTELFYTRLHMGALQPSQLALQALLADYSCAVRTISARLTGLAHLHVFTREISISAS